jgi:hypothetical protein
VVVVVKSINWRKGTRKVWSKSWRLGGQQHATGGSVHFVKQRQTRILQDRIVSRAGGCKNGIACVKMAAVGSRHGLQLGIAVFAAGMSFRGILLDAMDNYLDKRTKIHKKQSACVGYCSIKLFSSVDYTRTVLLLFLPGKSWQGKNVVS